MDDPRAGRYDPEVAKRLLAPPEECVPLAVALELALDVVREREPRRELVHLHGVIDDELGGDDRVDPRGVAAHVGHRVAHRRKVDDCRHAGEVLVQHARRREADLAARLLLRHPPGYRFDVLLGCGAEDVLEQDTQRVGKPRHVPLRLESVETMDLVCAIADFEYASCHTPSQPNGRGPTQGPRPLSAFPA